MKILLFFTIFALYYLEAKSITMHMPQQIQKQLCKKLSDHECTDEEKLQYKNYFKLSNDRLVLFFNTYNKNTLYPDSSLHVPVTVDINGKWRMINTFIKDNIEEILYDPHDRIWLHTMSTRRDGYSSLYYSKDGISWQKIKLPSIRTFQTMHICFQQNQIILTFQRVENDNIKAWVTTYQDAISPEPKWRLMDKNELYQKVCQKTSAYNNRWLFKSVKNSKNILFRHKYKNISISFPRKSFYIKGKTLPLVKTTKRFNNTTTTIVKRKRIMPPITANNNSRYTIQLGTFNYKTSLSIIYKEFARLKNRIVTKEVFNGERVQYKVFLESFNDIHEATIRLGEIQSEYNNSKIAKGAFVTKMPL